MTDEQHIKLYRAGEDGHVEELMDRYKNMVRMKASTMYLVGGEEQDLIQEGMIGLVKAVRDYNFDKDASFATFAEICVSRQMYNAIQASGRFKNFPLNNYISLTADIEFENGNNSTGLLNDMAADPGLEPERQVISKEAVKEINHLVDEILTDSERDVFRLNMAGIATSGIAQILGVTPKAADNSLQRAKGKLRKALSK